MEFDLDMSVLTIGSKGEQPRLGSCLMTLHCHRCSAVLGDSQAVCGELRRTNYIMIVSELVEPTHTQINMHG